MLSRLCTQFGISSGITLQHSARKFSFDVPKLARYTRNSLRDRLQRQKEAFKVVQNLEKYTDSIALRPPYHLLKALGFTAMSGFIMYYIAAYCDVKNMINKSQRRISPENIFADFRKLLNADESVFEHINLDNPHSFYESLSPGRRCILAIVAINVLVTLAWRYKPAELLMWRYFTNSFASKSLCSPMFLSVFSHKTFLHLALNMYVLWSFAPVTINKFLGVEQFLAFYSTSGIFSSLLSLVHKSATRSSIRALGASGAILAVLVYACMKMPDARLSIIFLPMFTFSAESAVYGIILFDLIGLLLGFRLFDHAAHLGGALFGLFYANYGEEFYCKRLRPAIMELFNEIRNEKRQKRID